jgi:hypothetical protein
LARTVALEKGAALLPPCMTALAGGLPEGGPPAGQPRGCPGSQALLQGTESRAAFAGFLEINAQSRRERLNHRGESIMPLTRKLHKLLKQNLEGNLRTLAALEGHKGLKLRFTPETGLFTVEKDGKERTFRNMRSANKDSATSKDMFANPILVTMYEARVQSLERRGEGPQEHLLRGALGGLRYLQDVTYAGHGNHRQAIEAVINRSNWLLKSTDRSDLADHINMYVDFARPVRVLEGVSHGLELIVSRACSDHELQRFIRDGLFNLNKHERGGVKVLIEDVRAYVYDEYYKAGGDNLGQAPAILYTQHYLEELDRLAFRYNARTQEQSSKESLQNMIGPIVRGKVKVNGKVKTLKNLTFIHFFSDLWGHATRPSVARVYIHIKADERGDIALNAVEAIFKLLPMTFPGAALRRKFCKFKICNLPMLYKYADSIVMWTADYETAESLAEALKDPLQPYTAGGLPTGVEQVSMGIGIATEPEVSFDDEYKGLDFAKGDDEKYSFGTFRSEIIARGLITAALRTKGYSLPDPTTCAKVVAEVFDALDIDPRNPHKRGDFIKEEVFFDCEEPSDSEDVFYDFDDMYFD